jgi:hypothetical protein
VITTLLFAAALLPWRVAPARPTVGDLITIRPGDAQQKIVGVTPGEQEVVKLTPDAVVIRSFKVGKQMLTFTVRNGDGTSLQRLDYEIFSVLPPKGEAKPAPLAPPLPGERNRRAETILITAALAAILSWAAVLLLQRRREASSTVSFVDPYDEYESTLAEAEKLSGRPAAARASEAVRRFLARVDPRFSGDLTTRELLRTMQQQSVNAERIALLKMVLEQGDIAKFAPWYFAEQEIPFAQLRRLAERPVNTAGEAA